MKVDLSLKVLLALILLALVAHLGPAWRGAGTGLEIGRASCRERV